VVLKREGDTLVLSINGSTDTLRVNSYFSNDATYGYQVEQIKFADGIIWNVDAVKAKALIATNENDTLYGYASADTLSGLSGDDTVYARAGNDSLDGGAGDDQLNGEDGDDLILGGTQNDRLDGGNGADTLQGQDGDDMLSGQAGNDTLDGGIGNDTLDGGAGNDLINGGLNADRLTGGSGSDNFSYQNPNEGADVITDFNGNFDRIQVSAAGFGGGLVAGMDLLASGRYVENSTGLATSAVGTGQFIYLTSSNQLYWDGDGEGGLPASLLTTFSNPVNWSSSGLQVV
jgi:Ca2+-binding RTX toxin-like protein